MLRFMRGDKDAARWCIDLIRVADVWDNLIDMDVDVFSDDVDAMCSTALLSMACNPFFQKNAGELAPIMRSSIRNWKIANAMSFRGPESRIQSHVLRYSAIDAIIACTAIVGGEDWALDVGPELRERYMQDPLQHYLQELAMRDYDIETDEYLKHGCRVFESCLLAPTEIEHISALHKIIAPQEGALIGDFGCGVGEVSRLMSKIDATLNFFLVTNSRRQIELLPNGAKFLHYFGDFSKQSAPDFSLDSVMFNQSIGYSSLDKALSCAFNALKSGGNLLIWDFLSNDSIATESLNWGYAVRSASDFLGCLKLAGFIEVCITTPKTFKNDKFINLFNSSEKMRSLHSNLQSASKGVIIQARKP